MRRIRLEKEANRKHGTNDYDGQSFYTFFFWLITGKRYPAESLHKITM